MVSRRSSGSASRAEGLMPTELGNYKGVLGKKPAYEYRSESQSDRHAKTTQARATAARRQRTIPTHRARTNASLSLGQSVTPR